MLHCTSISFVNGIKPDVFEEHVITAGPKHQTHREQ